METGAISSLYVVGLIVIVAAFVYLLMELIDLRKKIKTLTEIHELIVGKNHLVLFIAAIVKQAGGKVEIKKSTLEDISQGDFVREYADMGRNGSIVIEFKKQ